MRRDTSELVGHAMIVASCAAEAQRIDGREMIAAAFSLVRLIENGCSNISTACASDSFARVSIRIFVLKLAALGVTFLL